MPDDLFIKTQITDPAQYQKYVEAVRPLAARHGSRYVVRSRPVEVLEGSSDASSDYAPVRKLREAAGEVHVVLADELPLSPPSGGSPAVIEANH